MWTASNGPRPPRCRRRPSKNCDGWLLAFDSGTVNRAKSAVPLQHVPAPDAGLLIDRIEARYAAHGLAGAVPAGG